MIHGYIAQEEAIEKDVMAAISFSYNSVLREEGAGDENDA
jgi:hypothetical protein